MADTWILGALQAGLRFLGLPAGSAAWRTRKASPPTMQENLNDYQALATQATRLLKFRDEALVPMMEDLALGRCLTPIAQERIAGFIQGTKDLGPQCTHAALVDIVDQMRRIVVKDFASDQTYQELIRLKLSIEEGERVMIARKRELKHAYPRRPGNRG